MTPEREKELFEKLDSVADSQRRMEIVLVGDKKFDTDGLKQKVDYHGKKIREFNSDKIKVVTGATILGTIAGYLASLWKH
jgi:hypothetical protein